MKDHCVWLLPICLALAPALPLGGQMLLVDRALPASSPDIGLRLGWTSAAPGFLGDHFEAGAPGEVWIIDSIRTWAAPDSAIALSARVGDLYEKVVLFGGIESNPPQPGQPPEPECDCHNLMTIKSLSLPLGSDNPEHTTEVSNGQTSPWQLDFRDLHWSVPGGRQIQFGTMGFSRSSGGDVKRPVWYSSATLGGGEHQLKTFDADGKLLGLYVGDGSVLERTLGIRVQVWGHLAVNAAIFSSGQFIHVVLHGSGSFDVNSTDLASLRFGPGGASPVSNQVVVAGARADLSLRLRAADARIRAGDLVACLNGRQQSGVPFEACDALAARVPGK